jgi:hypothetical protein
MKKTLLPVENEVELQLIKETIMNASQIKNNDLLAIFYYVKVVAARSDNELLVKDLSNGQQIQVRGKDLIETCYSADQFDEEKKVSKTQAAEILINSPNRPLTVSFTKQDGQDRTLRGKLVCPEPLLGRSMVEDLDNDDKKNRLRQVDHRTINWLIVDGKKYVVK